MAVLDYKKVIATATAQERWLNTDELEKATASLNAATSLTINRESLARGAAQAVIHQHPWHLSTKESLAKFVQDIDYSLRYISYCLVVGGTGPIDDMFADCHTYDLSTECSLDALKYVKANHGLTGQEAVETDAYIDYLMNALNLHLFEAIDKREKSENIEILGSLEENEMDLGVEQDIVVTMPPISRRKVILHVKQISMAKPKVVFDEVADSYSR